MNIKVSGITQLKQLQQLEGLNIDFAGLIFQKDSPQYLGDKIDKTALKNSDFDLKKVGVFKDPDMIDVLDAIDEYGLDVVELQGNESAEMCEDLSSEVEVIKAFHLRNNIDIDEMIKAYDAVCDYYLFNSGPLQNAYDEKTGSPEMVSFQAVLKGGNQGYDWKILTKAKIEKPFFLSGGISINHIEAIKKFTHPDFYGVDINSRFDKEPGVKDMALVLQFLQGLK